ncbi:MAG TPA: DUF433 domain-containing protein [Acidobacteriaceae bacterium]|nr:DUF433 domain-containing protein [Acidobacteriaceae bacterium]
MHTFIENLTTTEAAVAAGVTLPQINRVIDDRILPDNWYSTSPVRTFRTDACLFIAFYYETAGWLTASARLQTIRDAAARQSSWEEWKNYAVHDHFLTLNFYDLWKSVDARLRKLADAQSMVVEDPEILSGTPVVRGTRVPVHRVAALFDGGTSVGEIMQAYPSLTESQIELASIYAKAVPQRGRPKQIRLPVGTKILNVTSGRLQTRAN